MINEQLENNNSIDDFFMIIVNENFTEIISFS